MVDVSDTAYAIARIRADEGARAPEARLFEDPYAARFFAGAGPSALEGTARFLSLPFFEDGIRLRTRAIDDVVRASIAEGAKSLVLLGAGFDSRALRIAELAAVDGRAYEVDFPSLLAHKRALLGETPRPVPIHELPCDFRDEGFSASLQAALAANGFRSDEPSIFVWEGVTAYVGLEVIDRTLAFVARTAGRGSTLVFDYGTPLFDTAEATARARRAGFSAFEELAYEDLWRRIVGTEPHPNAAYCRLGVARV